jgi:DNA-binding transcriptional ArsR family regulator
MDKEKTSSTIGTIFDKISQISVLSNPIRFRILLDLFNSNIVVNRQKMGLHSRSLNELEEIIGISPSDLHYHLSILSDAKLVQKMEEHKGYYHITHEGKDILRMFGINVKLIKGLIEEMK